MQWKILDTVLVSCAIQLILSVFVSFQGHIDKQNVNLFETGVCI